MSSLQSHRVGVCDPATCSHCRPNGARPVRQRARTRPRLTAKHLMILIAFAALFFLATGCAAPSSPSATAAQTTHEEEAAAVREDAELLSASVEVWSKDWASDAFPATADKLLSVLG